MEMAVSSGTVIFLLLCYLGVNNNTNNRSNSVKLKSDFGRYKLGVI